MAGAGWRDWTAGEVVTEALLQTYLQDQVVMAFADASARDAALGAGSEAMLAVLKDTDSLIAHNGSAWRAICSLIGWPVASLSRSSAQAIPDATTTTILWNDEDIDTHGGHSVASNTNRYTAPTGGYYLVTACIVWDNDPDGRREVHFRKNGSTSLDGQSMHSSANTTLISNATRLVQLDPGDWVEVRVFHTAGNSLSIQHASPNTGSRFDIAMVAPNAI